MRACLVALSATCFFAGFLTANSAAAASGGPAKQRSILVLELKGDPSVVDHATLTTITSTVSVSVSKRKGLNVLTAQDVKNLVDVEAQRQMMGCTPGSESCLAEVANAMGAELVLSGDVGKLGASYVINLHLFDAAKARSVGRDNVVVADLALLPQTLDAAIAGLLTPITGEQGLTSKTGGVSIPTVDMNALKSGGLKAINMQAETALEHAMDMQDDPNARPEAKRDAWCALTQVPGSNPYLGPSTKACDEWTQYVAASAQLEQSLAADYDTLAGFLQLKRKSKQQKLEAVDAFLQSYARLDNEDVKSVQEARRRLANGDDATLPSRKTGPVAPTPPPPPPEPEGPSIFDGVKLVALDFDTDPHFGLVIGSHLSLNDGQGSSGFEPGGYTRGLGLQLPPSLIFGMRMAYAAVEGGINLGFDFKNGPLKETFDEDGEPERDALTLLHGYAGLQTFSIGVDDLELIRPSFGFDVYNDFDDNDVGIYIANTVVGGGVAHLRGFVRFRVAGDPVVAPVQVGLELSLDALFLLEE